MFKRLLLLALLLAITKFSHTPGLTVSSPASWLHSAAWKPDVTLWSILGPHGSFYGEYKYGWELEFFLRKAAHLSFFGALALLFYWNLRPSRHRYKYAWLLLVAFAFLDELHQSFVWMRDGKLIDVLIDALGGTLFLFIFWRMNKQKNVQRKAQKNALL